MAACLFTCLKCRMSTAYNCSVPNMHTLSETPKDQRTFDTNKDGHDCADKPSSDKDVSSIDGSHTKSVEKEDSSTDLEHTDNELPELQKSHDMDTDSQGCTDVPLLCNDMEVSSIDGSKHNDAESSAEDVSFISESDVDDPTFYPLDEADASVSMLRYNSESLSCHQSTSNSPESTIQPGVNLDLAVQHSRKVPAEYGSDSECSVDLPVNQSGRKVPAEYESDSDYSVDLPVNQSKNGPTKTFFKDAPRIYYVNTQKSFIGIHGKLKKSNRVYDCKHFCLYCEKPYVKLPEHLQSRHRDEDRVKHWMAERNTKEGKSCLAVIRNEGDDQHNRKVVRSGAGELMLGRKPKESKIIYLSDVSPCPGCTLWVFNIAKHRKYCPFIQTTRNEEIRPKACSEQLYKEVIVKLCKDDQSEVVKQDEMIIMFGNKSIATQGNKLRRGNYTSTKLRRCAELLIALRHNSGKDLTWYTALDPAYYDSIVSCVKSICGHEADSYKRPTTAMNYKQNITQLADIKRTNAIKHKDETAKSAASDLMTLLENNWSHDVNYQAEEQLRCQRYHKEVSLPVTVDLDKLTAHLRERCKYLSTQPVETYGDYRNLVQVSQARLLVFNKRRPGELSQMTMDDFDKSTNKCHNEYAKLTKSEEMIQRYHRVTTVRGKCGKDVPVLIPHDVESLCQTLADEKIREKFGITGPYLFGNQGKGVFKAHVSLQVIVDEIPELENPGALKATMLRKYISTFVQVLSLREHEMNYVLEHMGHTFNVNMEHYRTMSRAIETSKIAKLMMLADSGKLSKYEGKNLDDIDISDSELDLELMVSQENQDNAEEETTEGPPSRKNPPPKKISSVGLTKHQVEVYEKLFLPLGDNPFKDLRVKIRGTALQNCYSTVKNRINADVQKIRRYQK